MSRAKLCPLTCKCGEPATQFLDPFSGRKLKKNLCLACWEKLVRDGGVDVWDKSGPNGMTYRGQMLKMFAKPRNAPKY